MEKQLAEDILSSGFSLRGQRIYHIYGILEGINVTFLIDKHAYLTAKRTNKLFDFSLAGIRGDVD